MANLSSYTSNNERVSRLVGEALLFGLLRRTLYSNPVREWLEPLAVDNLFEEAPFAQNQPGTAQGLALLRAWAADCEEGVSDAMLTDLRVDYLRLFVGQGTMVVPSWESVYFSEERLLFQERTLDVRARYERLGMAVQKEYKEPDDHIAFELGFVAHCASVELQALECGEARALAEITTARREFLSLHLLQWGLKWANLAYEHAQTDFYRGLALLVRGSLTELMHVYDIAIPEKIEYPGLSG